MMKKTIAKAISLTVIGFGFALGAAMFVDGAEAPARVRIWKVKRDEG